MSLPPPALLPVVAKVKNCYLTWITYQNSLPKVQKYSLGLRIEGLFVETIEAASIAWFLPQQEKQPYIRLAIRKWDTLKVLLLILWEAKGIDNKKYINLSVPMEEVGKMLGGWNGQIAAKQNSPAKAGEK
ncbi:MAG: four helix bundle protein [Candidatus Zambryskibacteria bacterium]|nr:four helix bundle protein [Candidatus Zambryskibacteria bacterium]